MRKILPFLCLMTLGACGVPSHWEKPGADAAEAANDRQDCTKAAQREAFKFYTHGFGPPVWGVRLTDQLSTMHRESADRAFTEVRLRAFCMRSRGYELVPDVPAAAEATATLAE